MKTQEKPIKEWLETIADPTIREAAISQINEDWKNWPEDGMVYRLSHALSGFNNWRETEEGDLYWSEIYTKALKGQLKLKTTKKLEKMKITELTTGDTVTLDNGVSYKFTKSLDGSIFLVPFEDKRCTVEIWYNGRDFIPVVPQNEVGVVGTEGALGTLLDVYEKHFTVGVQPKSE